MAFRDLRSLTEMMRALGYPRFVRFQAEVDFEITQKMIEKRLVKESMIKKKRMIDPG